MSTEDPEDIDSDGIYIFTTSVVFQSVCLLLTMLGSTGHKSLVSSSEATVKTNSKSLVKSSQN